jgi:hypothetical protein
MRVEVAEYELTAPARGVVEPIVKVAPRRRRIDRFDLGVLVVFALVSVWVLGLDLWQVIVHGRQWTGTDGFFLVDQMQYLAWIRDASHHVFSANLFVLRPTPSDYFQPAVAISGALSALGMAPWLSLLLWKPVAVVGVFFAARAYVRRSLFVRRERRAALVLTLFFGSFTIVYGAFGVLGDLFPGFLSWGYPFGLMALAAMIAALLVYDRDRRAHRLRWTAPVLGALASSLHPWQGELLILTLLGTEVVLRRDRVAGPRRLHLLGATVIASGVPLLYYMLLGHADLSWGLAREASKHTFSFVSIALALLPLAIPAALAWRRRSVSFLATVTRAWPIAAFLIYVLSATELSATPLHAFEGITLPLAVMAVEGVQRARPRALPRGRLIAALAIAALTVPAGVWELATASQFMAPQAGNANFITRDEHKALNYLAAQREHGGVLTRFYLGVIVPAQTGRRTYVGNCLWSEPDCTPRAQESEALFDGELTAQQARQFVLGTGARFVLADCDATADLSRSLAPILTSVRSFGCATVYRVA